MRAIIVFTFFGICNLAFSQTTLNLSHDLVRLQIASSDMTPNQPSLDSRPLLEKGVAYANQHNFSTVIADPGAYYFLTLSTSDRHVNLAGVTNLTIDLQGSDLYFAYPTLTALALNTGTNAVLQNFTVDYLQLPFTQLQVTAVNAAQGQVQFTVISGWQKPSALTPLLNPDGSDATRVFFFRDGRPVIPNPIPAGDHDLIPVKQPLSDTTLTVDATLPNAALLLTGVRPGDIAVLTARTDNPAVWSTNGGTTTGCVNCIFRNIRIYSGQVGFEIDSPQSTLLERIYIMPRPGTDRLVSTVAGGITPFQMGPNNTLRQTRAIRTLDDGIAPHIWVFGSVQHAASTRTIQVQGDPGTALHQSGGQLFSLPTGSPVVFEATDGTILGNATVVSQAMAQPVNGLNQMLFTFDRDLPGNLIGSYIYSTDPAWRGANTVLDRNTVQQQVGTGAGITLWGMVNTTVTGSYIRRTNGEGIALQHYFRPTDWIVPPMINTTLTSNVIDGTNVTVVNGGKGGIVAWAVEPSADPMPTSPHQNVTVSGNFVGNPARAAVWIGNTNGGSVTNNYFLNPNNNVQPQLALPAFASLETQPLVVETSVNVTTANNTIDLTSGRMFVTDTQFNELTAYAPGSTIRLNAYNLGALPKPSITLTDPQGNVWSLAIQNTSTHAIDVQIPASAATGGAYLTLTSGAAKYLGTLLLDPVDNLPALNECTYEVSSSSNSVTDAVSGASILVVTQSGCSYQALATDPFVTVSGPGTGTGIVTVSLVPNSGATRTTTVEVAGIPVNLTQPTTMLPNITSINTSGAGPTIAQNTWIEIKGAHLTPTSTAPAGVIWSDAPDFLSGRMPTQLGPISVKVNGKPAFVYFYCSAATTGSICTTDQINVLTPIDSTTGPVQVVVTNDAGDGPPFTVTMKPAAPSFLLFSPKGYVAATHSNYSLLGPTSLFPGSSTPAHVGETVVLYGVGFGLPTTTILNGASTQSGPLPADPVCKVGGNPATVAFSGIVTPGLTQINLTIPSGTSSGDAQIACTYQGVSTPQDLISIQ